MNSEYTLFNSKHINSFGANSQFWADYYYKRYREGTKMFYRLKTKLTYINTVGGSGTYNDPVVATFKMNYDGNPSYDRTFSIKPANNGTMYSGYSWEVESDWFSIDKTSGTINCMIGINNSNTWGFDDPNYYFVMGVLPAMSTIKVNDGIYFDVDKEEGISNTVPVVLTKYDNSYKTKLKIVMTNIHDQSITLREYQDFDDNKLTFTEEELQKIYNATPDWKMFYFDYYLETFTANGESLGVFTDRDVAKISDIDLKPIFSDFTFSDNNPLTYELTGNRAVLVKGYSNIRMTVGNQIKAIARKGASIKKYSFVNGEQSKDYVLGNYPAFADLNNIKDRNLTVWAIDTRDESTKVEKIATEWVDYKDIEKVSFIVERKDGGTSSQVTLKLEGKIWDGNFGVVENKIKSAIYKYKKTDSSEWIDGTTKLNVIKNGNNYSLEQDIVGDLSAEGFDQEESYDIYIEISDELSTISDTITLGAGSPAQAIYKNNIALGRPYDEQAGGKVQGIYEVGDLFLTLNKDCDPAKRFGGTWDLIAKGKTLVGVDEEDEDFKEAGKTGGQKQVTLTKQQLPVNNISTTKDVSAGASDGYVMQGSYNVTGSYNFGGSGQPFNNMPPHLTCYIWQRIS